MVALLLMILKITSVYSMFTEGKIDMTKHFGSSRL